MQNIMLIYGGRSYEHDVSVITAVQIGELWSGEDRLIPVYMREGEMYVLKEWRRYTSYTGRLRGKRATLVRGGLRVGAKTLPIGCALLATHGGEGEDGTLAALLQYYGIPYTAADSVSSGMCMDKILCKRVLGAMGFSVVEGGEAEAGVTPPLPAVCKPARLGSSIGVAVARTPEEWRNAYEQALAYDRHVLYERYVEGAKEYNCAALMDRGEVRLSAVERPVYHGDAYTFGDKYKHDCPHELPAEIGDELYHEIRATTEAVYCAMGLWGVVRVDYLYDGERLYVNEINTIPGGLSYRLFSAAGLPLGKLLATLVANARLAPTPKVEYARLLSELVGTYK